MIKKNPRLKFNNLSKTLKQISNFRKQTKLSHKFEAIKVRFNSRHMLFYTKEKEDEKVKHN